MTDLIFQGATQRVILRTDDGAEIVAHLDTSDHSSGRPGDRLWLSWSAGGAYALAGASRPRRRHDHRRGPDRGVAVTGPDPDGAPAEGSSRRDFLVRSGVVGAVGVRPSGAAVGLQPAERRHRSTSRELTFDNWPAYIDGETGRRASQEDTDVDLKYLEGFNDNNEYFAKIIPSLSRGKRITADVLAPTNWMAAPPHLPRLGAARCPLDLIPNAAANLRDDLRNPTVGPHGRVHAAVADRHDRHRLQHQGHRAGSSTASTTCSTPSSTGASACSPRCATPSGSSCSGSGIDPRPSRRSTRSQPAFDRMDQAKSDGQIRAFTGNDYLDDLSQGNFAACVGWSGDVAAAAARTTPTCASSSPRRAGCAGPTRWCG